MTLDADQRGRPRLVDGRRVPYLECESTKINIHLADSSFIAITNTRVRSCMSGEISGQMSKVKLLAKRAFQKQCHCKIDLKLVLLKSKHFLRSLALMPVSVQCPTCCWCVSDDNQQENWRQNINSGKTRWRGRENTDLTKASLLLGGGRALTNVRPAGQFRACTATSVEPGWQSWVGQSWVHQPPLITQRLWMRGTVPRL